MEGISQIPAQEKERDPRLELLWDEYEFPGRPPFSGSVAETRLKEACDKYSEYVDRDDLQPSSGEAKKYITRKFSVSDGGRRKLHNEIALMVSSSQRSGMGRGLAEHIADFAYEYSRGYKINEAYKYKGQAGNIN